MIPSSTDRRRPLLALLLAAPLALGLAACSESAAGSSAPSTTNAAVAPWRVQLLELAFEGASDFPLDPHVKNRSRAQAEVVDALLALDQPARVPALAERIADWRRGRAYAALALHEVRAGEGRAADGWIERALAEADRLTAEEEQAWRVDRILATVAAARALRGEDDEAQALAVGLEPSEQGPLFEARARRMAPEDFDAHFEGLETVFDSGDIERIKGALGACVLLYDRFYDDAERRARLDERMQRAWRKMPQVIGLGRTLELAEVALAHGDPATALELAERARATLDGASAWLPEDEAALRADVAALLYRAGAKESAAEQLRAARATFDEGRARIADIYHAGALRHVAEAQWAMGDRAAALATYAEAVEAGVHNPNSRPRCDDLVATCVSLAVHDVEPDPALLARLREVRDGLGDPW